MKATMQCPVCRTEETKWRDVTHLRLKKVDHKGKPIDMSMCETCGFVTYPSRCISEADLKEYYRKNYRPGPQIGNLFTGERKIQYHKYLLGPVFEEWKQHGITKPVIGEIGSAYGMFLDWVRQEFPEADIHGTELTQSYRRVAMHEYGLDLKEDFDTSKKYDLIVSYHVLEHQMDPDVKLKEYAACLKDNGLFYLSLPIWFREAGNGAVGGFDIENHWAPDHINSWSEEHLEWIIEKAGLEIGLKNTDIYGNTYLLKKKTSAPKEMPKFEFDSYLKKADRIYKAWCLLQENRTAEAIELWKNMPAAWVNHYELNRANFHKSKEETDKFFKAAIESCPNSADILMFVGDVLTRYERYDESYDHLARALTKKPNNPTILMGIANTFRMRAVKEKDQEKKNEYLRKSINICRFVMTISTELFAQAVTWAYSDESLLPISSGVE